MSLHGMVETAEAQEPREASAYRAGSDRSRGSRRVLLIAFSFPPQRTSGVYRPAALTRYLKNYGWQTTVLTVQGADEPATDTTLLDKLPSETRVVRTAFWQIKGWEKVARNARNTVQSVKVLRSEPVSRRQSAIDRAIRILGGWVQSLLYFPDDTVGWVPLALEKALALHLQERFDVIYTTHPPRAAHVIGLLTKLLCGVPWVAEFRDPWIIPEDSQGIPGIPIPARARNQWLARKMIFRCADALIPVTEGYADELRNRYEVADDRIRLVPNGFDEDDFQDTSGAPPAIFEPGYVHWSHFGTIYPGFSGSFFPMLADMVRSNAEIKHRLRIHIIGFPDEQTDYYARESDLRDMIKVHRFLQHRDALEAMRRSHGLLLFYSHEYVSASSVPGKLYEYLRVGRPILAVAYDGGVRTLVEGARAGWVVPPDDPEAMRKALTEMLAHHRNGKGSLPVRQDFVAQFRYDQLAGKLADVLDGVAKHGR